MFAILAAVGLLLDPTTTFKATEPQVSMSEPVSATCEVKMPSETGVVTVPCMIAALSDGTYLSAGFALPGNNRVLFVGEPINNGISVKAIVVNDQPSLATGACAAEGNVVICGASVEGSEPLMIRATY